MRTKPLWTAPHAVRSGFAAVDSGTGRCSMISPRSLTLVSLVLAYFMWSTGFVLIKVILPWLGAVPMLTGRMLPPLIVYLILWKKVQPARWYPEDFKWLALMVLFDPIGSVGMQSQALQLTSASQSGMIFACLPLLMAVAARLLFKEVIRRRCVAGILLAFAGVSLVALTGKASAQAPNPLLGNLFSLCAVFSLLGYTLTVKRLAARYRPYTLLCVQAVGSTCVHIPMLLCFFPGLAALAAVPWPVYLALFYVGAFPACLGYFLVNRAIGLIKAAHVSLLNTLVPVFVLIIGYLALGERLLPLQYFGSALVLGGAVLAGIPDAAETPASVRNASADFRSLSPTRSEDRPGGI